MWPTSFFCPTARQKRLRGLRMGIILDDMGNNAICVLEDGDMHPVYFSNAFASRGGQDRQQV